MIGRGVLIIGLSNNISATDMFTTSVISTAIDYMVRVYIIYGTANPVELIMVHIKKLTVTVTQILLNCF